MFCQPAVAHAGKQVQDQMLEELRRLLEDPGQEVSGNGRVSVVDQFP